MTAGSRAAEFRLGSTLGALGRTAQGLLEQAIAEVAPRWVRCDPMVSGAAGIVREPRRKRQLRKPPGICFAVRSVPLAATRAG